MIFDGLDFRCTRRNGERDEVQRQADEQDQVSIFGSTNPIRSMSVLPLVLQSPASRDQLVLRQNQIKKCKNRQ
ncbi:hypothetical protein D3C73_1483430 [compost metagenome]